MSNDLARLDRQGLRGFLDFVAREHPDRLLRIGEAVNTRFQMTAIVFELEDAGRSPVVIFENGVGHDMPVVTNIAGNRDLLAAVLGVGAAELPAAFRERCQDYQPAERIEDAPWRDIVIEGGDIDLTSLPVPMRFDVDKAS